MIELIQNETKKIMFKCCKNYAAQKKMEVDKVQLVLGLNEEGNTYTLCEDYVPKENYDIMQVLGVRIDFLGYSKIAPPFIAKSLIRFSGKYNTDLSNTKVLCLPTKNEKGKDDMLLFVYEKNDYLETISFHDLFREEDFEPPKME